MITRLLNIKLLALEFLALVLFTACNNNLSPVAENGLRPNSGNLTEKQIDLIYNFSKYFPDLTQVSIALIVDSQVVFCGIRRENDTLRYINNSRSLFEIGSITKTFTSTLLACFSCNGKLGIEDSIHNYLEVPIKNNAVLTFKALANHTSGLPREPSNALLGTVFSPNEPFKNYNEEKLKRYLKNNLSLSNDSIFRFQYSNIGYGLLGYILCQMEEKTFEELLKCYIFSKYNMTNSTAQLAKVKKDIVCGIDKNGRSTNNWSWDSSVLISAGGILSNAEDLSEYIKAHFNESNKELEFTRNLTFVDSTSINGMRGIGLGWIILDGSNGATWYWHNGGTHGYKSSIVFDVVSKQGVIVLSNVSAFNNYNNNIDQLGFELLQSLNE